jgi:hypothetical protein
MHRLPTLLLTASLLFWGGITERWFAGISCALLVQAAAWSRLRWDFGERASLVAWRLSVLFLTLAMVLVMMQPGPRITTMSRVFTWLPVVLLPLLFVQVYGTSPSLSLGTFSMMMRRRRQHAEKFGLPHRDVRFGFDKVYLCATLLSSSLGMHADTLWFYPGLVVLVSWAIIAIVGKGWRGAGMATAFALLMASATGIGGQKGLSALYHFLTMRRGGDGGGGSGQVGEKSTALGNLGEIKQSTEILWRILPEKGPLPRLLRVASYNRWDSPTWRALLPKDAGNETADFTPTNFEPDPFKPDDVRAGYTICPPGLNPATAAIDPALPRFRLRGKVQTAGQFGLLPLPANSASLQEFVFATFEQNSFGTFRIEPSQPICDARVLWGESFATEKPPWISVIKKQREPVEIQPDLEIPDRELAVIRGIATELGLYAGSTEDKITKLSRYFSNNFRYTRYNSIPGQLHKWMERDEGVRKYVGDTERPTYLGVFLEETKAGHCEFFATASALLLREVGVPTRYVSGFAVAERNPKSGEYIIRGTHAHAWCRAWDEENRRWLDVDLTPADWTGLETPRPAAFQDLRDRLQLLKEDMLVWRDKPGNMLIITISLIAPIGIGLAFVGRSLWRSRKIVMAEGKSKSRSNVPKTPLSMLEKSARKILGERPAGKPLGTWLMPLAARLQKPELLSEALSLHHRLRFDPGERSPTLMAELQARVAEIRGQLGGRARRP